VRSGGYTTEQLEFLREGYKTMRFVPLTAAFNARFGQNRTEPAIRSTVKREKLSSTGRMKRGKGTGVNLVYTPAMLNWLRGNYLLMPLRELYLAFNTAFGMDKNYDQIKGVTGRFKMSSGRDTRYQKGLVPWNSGKKGYMGPNRTSFKKGDMPWTKKPLYSESVNRDGYIQIIIPETNPWTGAATRNKHKHLWLWEQANGPLPKSHAVIFKDGDNRNFALDNLLCVTRGELLTLNLHDYKNQPAELKPSILALAKIEAAAHFRTKGRVPGAGRKKGTPNKPKEITA
jgi:hypothetical protein